MKSPFTGKEMKRVYEKRTSVFRGESYEFIHTAWQCEDTGEQFTDDACDMVSYLQITNQYRAKYGIPYTDEIIAVRNRYGISAAKMSLILGIGVNQYRLYEQGEVPSVSNGRMIRSIMNPKVMLEMVESSKNGLSPTDYQKIVNKVMAVIAEGEAYRIKQYETKRVFNMPRGAENGYAQLSLDRLKNVMLYFIERCHGVFFTKMNKLLFYCDFLSYRQTGKGMTGLAYKAIDYGPVPVRWDRIYSFYDDIHPEIKEFSDGREGTILTSESLPDKSLFSQEELEILDAVYLRFKKEGPTKISETSHQEEAWKQYVNSGQFISFEKAFSLKAINDI